MKLEGTGVSHGVAIGLIHYVGRKTEEVPKQTVEDFGAEILRFEKARKQAVCQLGELGVRTRQKLGAENAQLFEMHQMMLEDSEYRDFAEKLIRLEKTCAEYAVHQTARHFAREFAGLADEYMQARAADVLDVSRRVLDILQGKTPSGPLDIGQPVILAAEDFSPSETAQMERGKVLALLASHGSGSSHMAIFARTMGIPAVVALGDALSEAWDGRSCALDGETGCVILEPREEELAVLRQKQAFHKQLQTELETLRDKPACTRSGRAVRLFANIGGVQDARAALENGAEGIGLFRSEFLFLSRNGYPREETQVAAYREVLETMQGRPVILRTLDIGADKQADYFNLPQEQNPALGLRGIRLCLARPEMFKTQLRAIYRASVYGNLSVMLPMVASVWEVRQAKELAAEARRQLDAEGAAYHADLRIGIMIETPAAALTSDLLAREADFFSIGTNDLTQYALVADRQDERLARYADPYHPAVLRLIQTTAENARAQGIPVGICGELAADPALTARFLELGIQELSVAPSALLPMRRHIREMK